MIYLPKPKRRPGSSQKENERSSTIITSHIYIPPVVFNKIIHSSTRVLPCPARIVGVRRVNPD
jgi:hypothetical protein